MRERIGTGIPDFLPYPFFSEKLYARCTLHVLWVFIRARFIPGLDFCIWIRFCFHARPKSGTSGGKDSSAAAAWDGADSFVRILSSNCQMSRKQGSFSGKVIFLRSPTIFWSEPVIFCVPPTIFLIGAGHFFISDRFAPAYTIVGGEMI